MGWLDDAEAVLKQKKDSAKDNINSDTISLNSEQDKEVFKKLVKDLYEKATDREINLAIERIENHFTPPYSKREIMLYVKQFVEDT